MKEFLSKLSSYNLFNNLFPGVVFVALVERFSIYSFVQKDILIGAFLYYFIGLVISRIGSLVVQPTLEKIAFVKFEKYENYIKAAEKDKNIELFSEVNNTYRTLCALFISLIGLRLYEFIEKTWPNLKGWSPLLLMVFLLLLFLLSYRKQTSYITKRIRASG